MSASIAGYTADIFFKPTRNKPTYGLAGLFFQSTGISGNKGNISILIDFFGEVEEMEIWPGVFSNAPNLFTYIQIS